MKYIVTHPGQAHRDEFIACALLMVKYGHMPVYRREPTQEELEDPSIFVVDVGLKHEPERSNFDHHQYDGGDCAFVLVLKALGIYDAAVETYSWVTPSNVMDVSGPEALAKHCGIRYPELMSLGSPIERVILNIIGSQDEVSRDMTELMFRIGLDLWQKMDKIRRRRQELLEKTKIKTVSKVGVLLSPIEEEPALCLAEMARMYDCGITVSPDDRGPGLCLFRVNDHPQVDFTRIASNPAVSFAHKGGFIAKTKERLTEGELILLLMAAVKEV